MTITLYGIPPTDEGTGKSPYWPPVTTSLGEGPAPDPMDPDVMRKIMEGETEGSGPVLWYLAHPVGPDSDKTYEQNMEDGMAWWAFLIRAGLSVCAPWVGLCHALDDGDDNDRNLGMYIDIAVLRRCDGIIATGHKMSRGMRREWELMDVDHRANLIGLNRDDNAIKTIKSYETSREGMR